MTRAMISPARSISFPVVSWPNEKRTAELASDAGKPIASRTCEATTEPTMQAEPLEAQTPSRSSAIKIVSELNPAKLTFSVLASRCAVSPFCVADGKDSAICFHKRSRNSLWRSCSARAIAQNPFRRRRHAHDRGHIFGSRPALVLVRAAELDRLRSASRRADKAGPRLSVRETCARRNWRRPIRSRPDAFRFSRTTAPCRCAAGRRAPGKAPRVLPSVEAHRFRCWRS